MQKDPLEPPQSLPGAVPPIVPVAADLPMSSAEPEPDATADSPAWANGLRKIYDDVLKEPLPDSLIDLLSQLDAED